MSTIGVKAIKYPDGDSAINITDGGNVTLAGTLGVTGVLTGTSLDISGDIDIDGTTNLDVVDIDGALTQDGGAVFNEASADVDFRVESNDQANMFFVDGGNNIVSIVGGGSHLVGSFANTLQIEGTTGSTSSMSITRNTAGTSPPYLQFGKTRGTSVGSSTIVQNGDDLGIITFSGADGNDRNTNAAMIRASVDGTPSSNDMPGRLTFSTTADNASSVTERMRISSAGNIGIGLTSSATKLHIRSSTASSIAGYRDGTTGLIVEGDGASYIQIIASKTNPMGILFDGGNTHNDTARGGLLYDIDYGMAFKTGGATRWKIDEAGDIIPSSTSSGIVLGSTSNVDANTLDDYEEGTWTPALTNSYGSRQGTWGSSLSGTYTKVGRKVTVFAVIIGSGMYFSSERGYQQLTGMPFNANHTGMAAPYAGSWGAGNVTHSNAGTVYLYSASMYLHSPGSNVDTSGTGGIGITITYFT